MNLYIENPGERKRSAFSSYVRWILKNLLGLLVALGIVSYVFTCHETYRWVYYGLLKENMTAIKKNPYQTFDEKMLMKLGADYQYLMFIRQKTPENAVILYPSATAFKKKGSPFTHEIYNKVYATRFLYPRLLVTPDELPHSPLAGRVTHVAVVNGEGGEAIGLSVDSAMQFAIIPVTYRKE